MKLKYLIFKKRCLLFSFVLLIFIFIISVIVTAHSPSDMSLSFNTTSKELQVSITHQVSDPNIHYVNSIIVVINGVNVKKQEYTSQPLGNSFTYKFSELEAIKGDDIQVTADCNQGGSITKQLTVDSGGTITSEDGDDGGSTPGFELLILLISIIVIIIILRKRR